MIRINIISLGKLKEDYLRGAAAEYTKRISGYAKLSVIEIEPERLPESPSDGQIEKALEAESVKILKRIEPDSFTAAMCIEGKQLDSPAFSRLIAEKTSSGIGSFNFIIGSSHGLHSSVKQRANLRFSFSEMTFPHGLFRVMLLEQLYRAFKIGEGGKYHK